jgi:hypothetical protein
VQGLGRAPNLATLVVSNPPKFLLRHIREISNNHSLRRIRVDQFGSWPWYSKRLYRAHVSRDERIAVLIDFPDEGYLVFLLFSLSSYFCAGPHQTTRLHLSSIHHDLQQIRYKRTRSGAASCTSYLEVLLSSGGVVNRNLQWPRYSCARNLWWAIPSHVTYYS